MARFDAVLFDLDGTLVDSVDPWIDAYLETLRELLPHAITGDEFLARFYHDNIPLGGVLDALGVDRSREAEFRRRRDERYIAHLRAHAAYLPGARDVLEALRGDLPLAIVTTAWRRYVDAMDERLSFASLVDALVTCDDTTGRGKPAPYPFLLAAERLDVRAERCLVVGDQPWDMEAARRAGMTGCLARGPRTPRVVPADVVLEGVAGVPDLVRA